MFNELLGCVLCNASTPAVSFQRTTHCLRNSLGCLWTFRDPLHTIECIPVLILENSLGEKWGICQPHFSETSLQSPLYIWRDPTAIGFHIVPQILFNSSCLSSHSLPYPMPLPLPTRSYNSHHTLSPSPPIKSILFTSPREICMSS